MRILLGSVVVAILVLVVVASALAQTPATTVHKYDSYGFSVSLPSDCQPVSLGNLASAEMQEAYKSNGLAYVVLATSGQIPRGMSAHSAVNLAVQQISSQSAKMPGANVRLISASTGQGVSAQGFGMTVGDGGKGRSAGLPQEVVSQFGQSIYQAVVLIPVVDSPAVIGVVAVVGPSGRQGDIDSQLLQTVQTFTLARLGSAGSSGGARDVFTQRGTKGSKNAPAAPPQPDIKPFNTLVKGQIELVGVVKSTDASLKCVDMLVGQAVPFGGHGTMLSPPRLKRVYVKELAEDVKEGAVIVVVAGDTGPGKSVTADKLTVMDMSKIGL